MVVASTESSALVVLFIILPMVRHRPIQSQMKAGSLVISLFVPCVENKGKVLLYCQLENKCYDMTRNEKGCLESIGE